MAFPAKMTSVTLLLATMILAACASVPMDSLQNDEDAKQFAVPAIGARIYIYRDENFGSAIKVPVSVDGKVIGQSAPKTYFVSDVDPGKHRIICIEIQPRFIILVDHENDSDVGVVIPKEKS